MAIPTSTLLAPAIIIFLILHVLLRALFSPFRTVPGPFLARFTDAWYFWNIRKGSFQQVNIDLHKKYGPIVRYGPNRYSINDPEAAKTIYGLGNHFPKSSWYSAWASPGQWAIFSDQSIERSTQNRKMYSATYAMSAQVHYEHFVDECTELFTQRLSELSTSDSNLFVDMRHWFQCYAFDVIGLITYAKRIGFFGSRGRRPRSHRSLRRSYGLRNSLRNYLAGSKGAGRAYVVSFTNERIRESQTSPKPVAAENEVTTQDFLTKFLAKNLADPQNFTQHHVLMGCTSNMVAGSDTTAISLSALFYHLIKNPACMEKLRNEIDQLTSRGELSKAPTFKESQQMTYLQAVIKETLRIHPATGLPLERVVPEGGATIAGRFFPENTIVGVNSWVAHRNKNVFGEDAEVFNPDRWLTQDTARLSAMNRYYMPFGLGSRTCIGRHVSQLEMSKLVPRLIRDFNFELDPSLPGGNWSTWNYWFVKPVDFKVRISLREPKVYA
ncbi:hypothetical protein SNK04_005980 [Fusarium graminearum]